MYAKRMKHLEKGDEPFTLHTVKGFLAEAMLQTALPPLA